MGYGYGKSYYAGRFNPYNRHDTGMYCVYRKIDGKFLGHVTDCKSASQAKREAYFMFGCECEVSEIEE